MHYRNILEIRELLDELAAVLSNHGEDRFAQMVRSATWGDDERLEAFLVSNDLWGGAGSIADQAGEGGWINWGRRPIEDALIRLGRAQMRAERVNPRTQMWTEAFEQWQRRSLFGLVRRVARFFTAIK